MEQNMNRLEPTKLDGISVMQSILKLRLSVKFQLRYFMFPNSLAKLLIFKLLFANFPGA
jgi:hypothetical protein